MYTQDKSGNFEGIPTIAIWGKPAAGKTWLIEAFSHSLYGYEEAIGEKKFFLLEGGSPLGLTTLKHSPLRYGTSSGKYVFRTVQNSKYRDQEMIFIDYDGRAIDDALDSNTFLNSIVPKYLKYGILLLDPTDITQESDGTKEGELANYVAKFCSIISKRCVSPFYLAICVSKIDLVRGLRFLNAESVMDTVFSDKMRAVLEMMPSGIVKQEFAFSSPGYKGTREISNYQPGNPGETGVQTVRLWKPENVAQPFLWLIGESQPGIKILLGNLRSFLSKPMRL
jgi:GTPase SAR1 family protein